MAKIITVEVPKREWQTYYDPEVVGKYLIAHEKSLPRFEPIIELKPGQMIIPPPEPTLDNFLRWCATTGNGNIKPSKGVK